MYSKNAKVSRAGKPTEEELKVLQLKTMEDSRNIQLILFENSCGLSFHTDKLVDLKDMGYLMEMAGVDSMDELIGEEFQLFYTLKINRNHSSLQLFGIKYNGPKNTSEKDDISSKFLIVENGILLDEDEAMEYINAIND